MKPKTGFLSGSSPQVSENGAPVLTGRGLEETKRRIVEAFNKIRQQPQHPSEPTPQPQVELVYSEQHKFRFHERANKLSNAALSFAYIMKSPRGPVFEIVVPTESAEELYKEALGE